MCCLDPVHTGKGGVETGYIDNEILREPGTNLPKITGKAIKGMCRAYSNHVYRSKCETIVGKNCAGKDDHCGECPICRTFGTSKEKSEVMGAFRFNDAHICLFPVYSYTHGPIWTSTPSRFGKLTGTVFDFQCDDETACVWNKDTMIAVGQRLFSDVRQLDRKLLGHAESTFRKHPQISQIIDKPRLVLVSERLFSKTVNENLEIRTSVSIHPLTGTADEGALYTYEAIPMGAVLMAADVGYDTGPDRDQKFETFDSEWGSPDKVVQKGLSLAAFMGLGGMKTPGFGRMSMVLKGMD